MNDAVLPQVVHACHWGTQQTGSGEVVPGGPGPGPDLTDVMEDDEELVLGEAVGVGGLLQDGVEAAAGAVLHHQDLVPGVGLLAEPGQKHFYIWTSALNRNGPTSSSTANSFTMFLWFSFFRTSNSLIWTSSGRRKLRLLNTLTAYRSPVFCTETPL